VRVPHDQIGRGQWKAAAKVPTSIDGWATLVPEAIVRAIVQAVDHARVEGRPANLVLCPDGDQDGICAALILKQFLAGIDELSVSVLVDEAGLDQKCKRILEDYARRHQDGLGSVPEEADVLLVCDCNGDPRRHNDRYAVLLNQAKQSPTAAMVIIDHHQSKTPLDWAIVWDATDTADANGLQAWGLGLALRRRLLPEVGTGGSKALLGEEAYFELCGLLFFSLVLDTQDFEKMHPSTAVLFGSIRGELEEKRTAIDLEIEALGQKCPSGPPPATRQSLTRQREAVHLDSLLRVVTKRYGPGVETMVEAAIRKGLISSDSRYGSKFSELYREFGLLLLSIPAGTVHQVMRAQLAFDPDVSWNDVYQLILDKVEFEVMKTGALGVVGAVGVGSLVADGNGSVAPSLSKDRFPPGNANTKMSIRARVRGLPNWLATRIAGSPHSGQLRFGAKPFMAGGGTQTPSPVLFMRATKEIFFSMPQCIDQYLQNLRCGRDSALIQERLLPLAERDLVRLMQSLGQDLKEEDVAEFLLGMIRMRSMRLRRSPDFPGVFGVLPAVPANEGLHGAPTAERPRWAFASLPPASREVFEREVDAGWSWNSLPPSEELPGGWCFGSTQTTDPDALTARLALWSGFRRTSRIDQSPPAKPLLEPHAPIESLCPA
jgi:hypothetical protein